MRFIALSLLFLSLILSLSSVSAQYAGAFLTTAGHDVAASFYQPNRTSVYSELNVADFGGKKLVAHHMTIEFNLSAAFPAKFAKFYNERHSLKVLAYAHDTHGQALLVELEDNPCKQQGGIEIGNEWPHITISEQGQSPYTAVYSNDLVGRLFASNILKVKKSDSYGKPTKVDLVNRKTGTEWWGTAPEFTSKPTPTTVSRTYPATPVYVRLFPQEGRKVVRLPSIVCFNKYWNDTTVSCNPPQ